MSALGPSTGVPAKKRAGVAAPATAGRTSDASVASRAIRRAMDGRDSLGIDRTGRANQPARILKVTDGGGSTLPPAHHAADLCASTPRLPRLTSVSIMPV